jgi:hypothetical protein
MPEQGAHPQGVGGPPVGLVAVEHDRGVGGDALGRHQPGKALAVDVVAGDRVVEVGVPVELDRARDVAGLIQQHVLIRLGHHQVGVLKVLGQPGRGHQALGMGVGTQLLGRVVLHHRAHALLLRRQAARFWVARSSGPIAALASSSSPNRARGDLSTKSAHRTVLRLRTANLVVAPTPPASLRTSTPPTSGRDPVEAEAPSLEARAAACCAGGLDRHRGRRPRPNGGMGAQVAGRWSTPTVLLVCGGPWRPGSADVGTRPHARPAGVSAPGQRGPVDSRR